MRLRFLASREGHDDIVNLLISKGKGGHSGATVCMKICVVLGANVNRTTEEAQETACK